MWLVVEVLVDVFPVMLKTVGSADVVLVWVTRVLVTVVRVVVG